MKSKPNKADILVDEALVIASEIAAWKEKRAGEEANGKMSSGHFTGTHWCT